MQNNDKKYFIPVDGTPIEVSEEVYRAYYQPIWNTRYHAQKNGECRCIKAQLWKCDGVCPGCPFYAAGKKVSIDTPIGGEEDELTLGDTLADDASSAESILMDKDQCHNPGIRDETMKRLVIDVLGLDEFDEAAMDAQIENATILDHTVTFHFRDGHTESRDFLDKRHGTPWTEERREKARESMKAAWTDKRRKAMSERIKKIMSEKKWPKP